MEEIELEPNTSPNPEILSTNLVEKEHSVLTESALSQKAVHKSGNPRRSIKTEKHERLASPVRDRSKSL